MRQALGPRVRLRMDEPAADLQLLHARARLFQQQRFRGRRACPGRTSWRCWSRCASKLPGRSSARWSAAAFAPTPPGSLRDNLRKAQRAAGARPAGPTATARCATRKASRSRSNTSTADGGERIVTPYSRRCASSASTLKYRRGRLRADPEAAGRVRLRPLHRAYPRHRSARQRAARPLRLQGRRHRRLEQPDRRAATRRSMRWSTGGRRRRHAAGAGRAPARARPRAAPRLLRRPAVVRRARSASPTAPASSSSRRRCRCTTSAEDWVMSTWWARQP